MTRTSLICVGLAILVLGIDGGRVRRSPQFGANAQASAQAGGFGGPPPLPPGQYGPGFGGGFVRPHRFAGGPGGGFGGGPGFGSSGGGTISISKSISISRGGTAQSSAGSSASGK